MQQQLREKLVSKLNQIQQKFEALNLTKQQQTILCIIFSLVVAFAIYKFIFANNNKKKSSSSNSNNSGNENRIICGSPDSASTNDYDVIVCGGSISGTATGIQFAKQGRRVLVLEKDLSRPDTIIGELMQPGGIAILRKMGLERCALDVGVPAYGYAAMMDGDWVDLPFTDGAEGVSFHHGDFVTELRRAMLRANELPEVKKSGGRLTVIEAVASQFVFDSRDVNLVRGVTYRERMAPADTTTTTSGSASPSKKKKQEAAAAPASETATAPTATFSKETKTALASLVVCCDGAYSALRPDNPLTKDPHSHFVGMVLRHVELKRETRGNVILGKKGIILSYRLDPNEVRFLIDYGVSGPLPPKNKLIAWLRNDMKPELPEHLQSAFEHELQRAESGAPDAQLRARPHYHYTPVFPKYRGMVGIGDHGNMRHPLTGAGMTCALRDAYNLTESLKHLPNLGGSDRTAVQAALRRFVTSRPSYTSVLNILSWALYGVFTGPMTIRKAVMEYFHEGGDAVDIPLKMLAGLESSFITLLFHYINTMIAGAKYLIAGRKGERSVVQAVTFFINPIRIVQAIYFVCYATYLFGRVGFTEFVTPWRIFDRANSWLNF